MKHTTPVFPHALVLFLPVVIPTVAFAQVDDVFDLLRLVADSLGGLIPVLLGIIMVVIFWNLAQFVLHAGDEREREKYKQFMIWGVVSVFLIISFWGIIYAITNSFFGNNQNPMLGNPEYIDKNGSIIQL